MKGLGTAAPGQAVGSPGALVGESLDGGTGYVTAVELGPSDLQANLLKEQGWVSAPNTVPRNAAPCPSQAYSADIGPHKHGGRKSKSKVSAGLVPVESASFAWHSREDRAREAPFSPPSLVRARTPSHGSYPLMTS